MSDKWISVEDRLPEIEEHCLVYAINTNIGSGKHVFIDARRNFQGSVEWIFSYKPEYWMPLPEPPSE